MFKSINRLILMIAAAVSLALLAGGYAVFSGFGDRMLQQSAFSKSHAVAHLTFTSMYQLMSRGWKREDVLAFTDLSTRSVDGADIRLSFYRGDKVSALYGPIPQEAATPEQAEVMRTGKAKEIPTDSGVRYVFPMRAEAFCLRCHGNAQEKEVLGVITVQTRYDGIIEKTRELLLLVLLLLTPLPFVAAWLVALLIHHRILGFEAQIDAAMGQDGRPDLDKVDPGFEELREILRRFKKLAERIK